VKDTRVELVAELIERLPRCGATKSAKVRSIIAGAKAAHFHDFKSHLPMPKVSLVMLLREAGLQAIATRVIAGEFDETADAEDIADMALELKDEPELRRMLKLPDPVKA
jgi:hypothetical protein